MRARAKFSSRTRPPLVSVVLLPQSYSSIRAPTVAESRGLSIPWGLALATFLAACGGSRNAPEQVPELRGRIANGCFSDAECEGMIREATRAYEGCMQWW